MALSADLGQMALLILDFAGKRAVSHLCRLGADLTLLGHCRPRLSLARRACQEIVLIERRALLGRRDLAAKGQHAAAVVLNLIPSSP